MSTKAEIGKVFRNLEKFGYKVKAFGDNRQGRRAQTGFVDLVIFNHKYFICIEIKTADTNDKFSDEQKETARLLSSVSTFSRTFHYQIIRTLEEAKKLQERILKGNL